MADPSPPPSEVVQPAGMGSLRAAMVALGVLAFFVTWIILLVQVWLADAGKPPDLDNLLVGAATGLAGAIGAGFALAMGLEKKKDPAASLAIGATALPKLDSDKARSVVLTVGIYGYAVISSLAIITWVANQSETPAEIQGVAVGFAGYFIALMTSAFGAVRPTD